MTINDVTRAGEQVRMTATWVYFDGNGEKNDSNGSQLELLHDKKRR
jgi:hypothetical protein